MIARSLLLSGLTASLSFAASPPNPAPHLLEAGRTLLTLSPEGQITAMGLKGGWNRQLLGMTLLDSCRQEGPASTRSLPGGGIESIRTFVTLDAAHRCTLVDRFTPDSSSIRWEIIVEGNAGPWSTGISTMLEFADTANARFWTTWGSPGHLSPADWGGEGTEWHNPFETRPFRDMHLVYGGHFGKGGGYSIPVFSVMNPVEGSGVALAMSPEDPLLDIHMITTRSGRVTQTRRFHRLEKGKPVRFTMHLFLHEPDWRPVIAFVVARYPRFFFPQSPAALDLYGLGAYSSFEGEIDVRKFQAMGGIVNWKASFDFSYMGLFIPPVATDTTRWKRFDVTSEGDPVPGKTTYSSIEHLRAYARRMKDLGFATLNYYNITEFGGSSQFSPAMVYPRPEFRPEENVWTNPSAFLYNRFPGAILFGTLDHVGWHKRTPQQHMDSPVRPHNEPFWTWGGAIATDVGDSAYASFLLDQARLHVDKIPDAQGICVDRLDWLNEYNSHADDGASWLGGRPARSLLNSFRSFIPRLSAVMHDNGKAIFCNPHMNRLELMEHFDGIYNEFGHIGHNLNLSAFLSLYKPLLCWTPDRKTVMQSPDEYFQHHLLMGAFPTAPFPGNDHTILPDPGVERCYLDYGAMFTLLHGRKWVLLPFVVEVSGGTALCNVFSTGDILIPIMLGTGDSVRVILRHCAQLLGAPSVIVETWYPGERLPMRAAMRVFDDTLTLPLRLRRGCAFVRVIPG